MKISAKAEYACVAMVELAARSNRGLPVSIKAISEQYGMSSGFLMQIFMQLKGAGLVSSIRGASGGYQLARPTDKISLADIIDVIEGQPSSGSALDGLPPSVVVHTLQATWQAIQKQQQGILRGVTLAEIVKRTEGEGVHFYQI